MLRSLDEGEPNAHILSNDSGLVAGCEERGLRSHLTTDEPQNVNA